MTPEHIYTTINVIITFVFGTIFGSFASLASHRMPEGEDIVVKSSYCPRCKHPLSVKDLFPVLSWLISRGKCRYCGGKISIKYLLIELVLGALFVLIYLKKGFWVDAPVLYALAVCLVIISVTDIERLVIPDFMQISIAMMGIYYSYITYRHWLSVVSAVVAALILGLILYYGCKLLLKKEGFSLRYVKLLAVIGFYLNIRACVPFLLYSGVFSLIIFIIYFKFGKGRKLPLAPALALSLMLGLLFPHFPN